MTNIKRRLAKIEDALNPNEFLVIEDLIRLVRDKTLSEEEKTRRSQLPLHPDLKESFRIIEENRKRRLSKCQI